MITALGQFVRNPPQKPIYTLNIFLGSVDGLTHPDPLIVLPGDSIFGISPV
jgi:hypothetical protein